MTYFTPMTTLAVVGGLVVKHTLADYAFQTDRMLREKRPLGAIGGVQHAALHAALTFVALSFVILGLDRSTPVDPHGVIALSLADGLIHYFIDYTKARLGDHYKWTIADKGFWIAFGVDQLLHMATYLGIVAALAGATG